MQLMLGSLGKCSVFRESNVAVELNCFAPTDQQVPKLMLDDEGKVPEGTNLPSGYPYV